jgi:hypothetical protein
MSSDPLPPDERGELRTEVGQSLILIGHVPGLRTTSRTAIPAASTVTTRTVRTSGLT